jgi:hypothetical protein
VLRRLRRPALPERNRTLIGETSFGTNGNCSGVGYDFRLDTAEAQNFIFSTLASLNLSL